MINIVFFGSFQHYSTYIAKSLHESETLSLKGLVTTASLANETDTVHAYAIKHSIPVFTPPSLENIDPAKLFKDLGAIDLIVTAGYGKLLPNNWLQFPRLGALNLHFSLLPKYRGANPAEYALLRGESETGITLIEMASEFDTGNILSQTAIEIEPQDTRESLYEKLYTLGAQCIDAMLEEFLDRKASSIAPGFPQPPSPTPEAKRLHRRDGFIAWSTLVKLMQAIAIEKNELPTACQKAKVQDCGAQVVERACKALYGYPSLWTRIPTNKGKKIMKLFAVSLENNRLHLEEVQVEGQQKARFNQIKNIILV
jgi:methionyl-tRNA formyltransferase